MRRKTPVSELEDDEFEIKMRGFTRGEGRVDALWSLGLNLRILEAVDPGDCSDVGG